MISGQIPFLPLQSTSPTPLLGPPSPTPERMPRYCCWCEGSRQPRGGCGGGEGEEGFAPESVASNLAFHVHTFHPALIPSSRAACPWWSNLPWPTGESGRSKQRRATMQGWRLRGVMNGLPRMSKDREQRRTATQACHLLLRKNFPRLCPPLSPSTRVPPGVPVYRS